MKASVRIPTKQEVWAQLRAVGYVKKDPKNPDKFTRDEKVCAKLLESQFSFSELDMPGYKSSGYPIPSSVPELKKAMERNATTTNQDTPGGKNKTRGPIPDVTRRCLICTYRAYRAVYYRWNKKYPDVDVPDDYSHLGPQPTSEKVTQSKWEWSPLPPMSKKATSPVKPKPAPKKEPTKKEYLDFVYSSMKLFGVPSIWFNAFNAKLNMSYNIRRNETTFIVPVYSASEKAEKMGINNEFFNFQNLSDDDHPSNAILMCATGHLNEKAKQFTSFEVEHAIWTAEFDSKGKATKVGNLKVIQDNTFRLYQGDEESGYVLRIISVEGVLMNKATSKLFREWRKAQKGKTDNVD